MSLKIVFFFLFAAGLSYTTGKSLKYSFAGKFDIQSLMSYRIISYLKLKQCFRGGIRGFLALDVRKFGPGRQGGIFGRVLGRFWEGF